MLRPSRIVPALLAAAVLAGCGAGSTGPTQDRPERPGLGVRGTQEQAAQDLGFPALATKNTTRVAGEDPTAIAAAVARAVFPSVTAGSRPRAVVLAPRDDWRAAVAASVLMADPVRAPLLLSDRTELPEATDGALAALRPKGSEPAGDAQVVRIGDVPAPQGLRTTDVRGANPFALARAIDAFRSAAAGAPSDQVLIVSAEAPAYAMPAAAWAAKSGDPVLFVERDRVPPETVAALRAHRQPRIYILGPSSVVTPAVSRRLRRLGTVRRTGGRTPVTNAIRFARYLDGTFGWGIVDPGHGVVVTASQDPLVAAAAAPLSASGTYGPLLLTGGRGLARELEEFLLDIQPGYERDPVRGVYNRGWVLGDEEAVSLQAQARLDALLEIAPVQVEPPDAEPEARDGGGAATTATTPPRTTQTQTTPTPTTTTPAPTP